jgi:hypothetical protein
MRLAPAALAGMARSATADALAELAAAVSVAAHATPFSCWHSHSDNTRSDLMLPVEEEPTEVA